MQNVSKIETITPVMADKYLRMNTRNRAIRKSHVSGLVKSMVGGKWVVNGQPIIFDDDGFLIDGQHRLTACVESGVPFITYVIRGVSDSRAFTTIDIGKARGAHDMATYMGGLTGSQAKDVVAASRIVLAYERSDKLEIINLEGGAKMAGEEVAAYAISLCPLMLECSDLIGSKFAGMAEKSIFVSCAYLFANKNKSEMIHFFDMLHEGVFSSQYHPVKVLRDTLLMRDRLTRKTNREIRLETMALIVKAWASFRKGKEVRVLRWCREGSNRERFPEIV